MSGRPSNRPSKTQEWPLNHGEITIHLTPSDRVIFGKVLSDGRIGYVSKSNVGQLCIAIIGHQEIEGLQESGEPGKVEMFTGESIKVSKDDEIFTCLVDIRGLLSSVGIGNAGKDVTIILHLEPQEGQEKDVEKGEKIKKLTAEFVKKHEQLNKLAEQINELEKD